MNPKYGSRKFIVTIVGMLLTAGLALSDSMSGDVALVMTAAIAGYHIANSYVTGKGNAS